VKKLGPKPSRPGLEDLFIAKTSHLISSSEKGALREEGRGAELT
jgi:hypothetical protein